MTSPAQRLRDAAQGMREKAEEATPGPWGASTEEYHESAVWAGDPTRGIMHASWEFGDSSHADAAYIAAMSPPVALAVADLLDDLAECAEVFDTPDMRPAWEPHALDVAEAFLGGRG